MVVMVI